MAGKKKNVQSRAIDAFCVAPAREERKKAEKNGDVVRAEVWRNVEKFCISRREAAKGVVPKKKLG